MSKTNVGIIGAGGIGSFFIERINKLIDCDQLNNFTFTCYDDDIVELKNILYQNFTHDDIDDYKTEALSFKFTNIETYLNKRATKDDLKTHNLILLCVDNNVIRKATYENYKENNIPFIDARSNGKTVGIFSSDTENYYENLSDSTESFSCQYPYQLEKKEIELGNVIIADILAQKLLNYYRTKNLPENFVYNF